MNDVSSCSRQPRDNGADQGPFQTLLGRLKGLFRTRNGDNARETLEELIEEREEGEISFDEHERLLLGNILRLRDVTAADVMVPSADIVAVEARTSRDELLQVFTDCGHSRLPVYRGTLDEALGMVHIKDVVAVIHHDRPFALSKLVRRVLFVAPTMRVLDLLLEMRLKRTHMALVVDEYGGIDGLVTIEDVVEQIVGEIEDEHEQAEEPDLILLPDGVIEADGRADVEEFEDMVGPVLTEEEREEVDTLGGLVSYIAGRVPARGELIPHVSGMEFEVVEADPRRVKRLRVRRAATEPARDAANGAGDQAR